MTPIDKVKSALTNELAYVEQRLARVKKELRELKNERQVDLAYRQHLQDLCLRIDAHTVEETV